MDAADEEETERPLPSSETVCDPPLDSVSSINKEEGNNAKEMMNSAVGTELETAVATTGAEENESEASSPSPSPQSKPQEAGKKESTGNESSKQLAGSSKLEDQINLQHLVELMKIFYVSPWPG